MGYLSSVSFLLYVFVWVSTRSTEADQPTSKDQWQLIFKQTYPTLFEEGEWKRGTYGDATFSNLQDLENYRLPDGSFHFYLNYPELGGGNEWSQTSNPVTRRTPGVEGYKPIDIKFDTNGWGGLEYSGTYALLDGTPNNGNWFHAIGSFRAWSGGMPGPNSAVKVVKLYVKKSSSGA